MSARIYEFPENKKWQECYKAAIVEADSTKLPDRIAEAKKVIGQRARQLFQTTGNNFEEEQALEVAICALHALHGTLKSRPIAVQAIPNDLKTGTS
jgi:hypothetical protein